MRAREQLKATAKPAAAGHGNAPASESSALNSHLLGLGGGRPMSEAERESLIRSSNWNSTVAAATGFNEQLAKLMQSKAKADAKSLEQRSSSSRDDAGGGMFLPRSKVDDDDDDDDG